MLSKKTPADVTKSAPIRPDRATLQAREAERCLARGNAVAAETAATLALALVPDHPRALLVLARIHRGRQQFDLSLQTLEAAAAADPGDVDIRRERAAVLAMRGRHIEAIALLADPPPTDADGWFALGGLQDDHGDAAGALASAQRALERDPRHIGAKLLAARAQVARGAIDDAASTYRELARRPESAARAWFALADLKTVKLDEDELGALRRLQGNAKLTASEQVLVAFAFGQALDQARRLPEAFTAFADGNRRQRLVAPWHVKPFEAMVDDLLESFDRPAPVDDGQGAEAVFLLGLPRSGSTLAEQVLSAHPDVVGASELNDLPRVIADESKRRRQPYPQWIASATEADWLRLGAEYLERTRRHQSRRRFTDKYPENWLYAGAIPRMLPGARVLFCERDPVETLWSCFKQLFAPGFFGWSYDFESLARYAAGCRRVRRQAVSLDPARCRVLSHEALLGDPEGQIRDTLAFIGLDFDARCLDHTAQQREHRTASAAQVRQPLRASTARTAGYGPLLDPLRAAWSRVEA